MSAPHVAMTQENCLCADTDAVVVNCCVCGVPVKTCEREDAVDGSFLCPEHPEGSELVDGRWVCSLECWEVAADSVLCPPKENLKENLIDPPIDKSNFLT